MTACIFCEIVTGTAVASRVYENETTLAFMNQRQANAGHVLVIPKQHIPMIYDLDSENAAQLFQTVTLVARAIRACFKPDGLTIWQSNGVAAGQEIFHLHIHLLPRYTQDNLIHFYPDGLPAAQPRETLDDLAVQLRRWIPSL